MKTIYFGTMAFILILSASLLGYGIFINVASDNYIDTMMNNRVVRLRGTKVVYRDIAPEIVIKYANLQGKDVVDAVAQIDGTLVKLFAQQGQSVKNGEKICQIANRDIALQIARAETDIAKANAAHVEAQSVMERKIKLAEKNAISKSEMESAIAQSKATQAELSASKIVHSQLLQKETFQTLRAETEGDILRVYHDEGSFVSVGSPIVLIGNFDVLNTSLMITEKNMQNLLPMDDSYLFIMDMTSLQEKAFGTLKKGHDLETSFDVKFGSIAPGLEYGALLRNVGLEVHNPTGVLEPGLYVDFIIRRKNAKKILSIPTSVIPDWRNQKTSEVYIMNTDSRLEKREIKIGYYNSEFIEITEGLSEGDTVITSGIGGLNPGIKIKVITDVEVSSNDE